MTRRETIAAVALATLAAFLWVALATTSALASKRQESTFQDDNELLYVEPAELRRNLDDLDSLGVDRIRATILWKAIAPQAESRTRPRFDATDPGQYPRGAWDRYDRLIHEARARGMDVNFNVTGPSPLWANQQPPRADIADTYEPAPGEFGRFVAALGRRYSGSYVPAGGQAPLPRVDYWSIWNEPNHSGWLTPTWAPAGRRFFERSASLYRELFDQAWTALSLTGHGGDTVLLGETAPKGDRSKDVKRFMKPLIFVRALYCVDRRLRPLRGTRAQVLGCPEDPKRFPAEHPGLFAATGYAHHPYELFFSPSMRPLDREYVTMSSLSRLTRTLDRAFRRYGVRRRVPLYLTEYGYQTPPDKLGVSLARQALYLNHAEHLAWRNPRVQTLAQFLLRDDGEPIRLTFQSGLMSRSGRRKPSWAAYRLPIWTARRPVRRGRPVRVWALLRPAPNGVPAVADVELRPRGSRRWTRLRRARTTNERNYLVTSVRLRRSGHLRVRYRPPGGRPISSRRAFVRVR